MPPTCASPSSSSLPTCFTGQALKDRQPAALLDQWLLVYETLRRQHNISAMDFFNTESVRIRACSCRSKPARWSTAWPCARRRRPGRPATGLELGAGGGFALRVVYPVVYDGPARRLRGTGQGFRGNPARTRITRGHAPGGIAAERPPAPEWEAAARRGRDADWERLSNSVIIFSTHAGLPAMRQFAEKGGGLSGAGDGGAQDIVFDERLWRTGRLAVARPCRRGKSARCCSGAKSPPNAPISTATPAPAPAPASC